MGAAEPNGHGRAILREYALDTPEVPALTNRNHTKYTIIHDRSKHRIKYPCDQCHEAVTTKTRLAGYDGGTATAHHG
jgi:hypothetical protein